MATTQLREQPWAVTGANYNAHDLRDPWFRHGDAAGLDAPRFIPAGSTVKNSNAYEGCQDVFVIGRLAGRPA